MDGKNSLTHSITLNGRESCTITGVKEIIEFNQKSIVIDVTMKGLLLIKGQNLNIMRISPTDGEMDIEGIIDSLTYESSSKKSGGLRKLFCKNHD